ncbi:hypothetical protein G3I40_45150, partial [Streptomyces sp. SID14478]|nr:hypothetical protein [Streptomyces sp. SID14478]
MAWRDGARRRKGRPAVEPVPAPVEGPGTGVDAVTVGHGSAVPNGWDGGWRHTSAPQLTVSRSPLAVSDGLVFRAGLAAWRDPSFDTGLAHGVLPSAPAGLVSGVTHPVTGTAGPTRSGGAPLLLRALAPGGEEDNFAAEYGTSGSGARVAAGKGPAVGPEVPRERTRPELPQVQRRARADESSAEHGTERAAGHTAGRGTERAASQASGGGGAELHDAARIQRRTRGDRP